MYDLEASAGKVVEAAPGADVVYHTNHPLRNDDRNDRHKGQERTPASDAGSTTKWRDSRTAGFKPLPVRSASCSARSAQK